jgi:hypothetical protein
MGFQRAADTIDMSTVRLTDELRKKWASLWYPRKELLRHRKVYTEE